MAGEYQPAMERVRSGARGYVALDTLHRENLDRTLAAFGAELPEADRAALNHAWEKLPPWPDSLPGLTRLKARFIIAPCSNGSIALMTRLAKFGGLPWDCILGAEIAQAYKPDPKAYLGSAAALALPPERVMMVAAHNDDLAAARALGMATAFVPRPAEHGPGQTTDLAPTQDWDVVAEDFSALAAALSA
jgi:2-haloacid dehalogenase